MTYHSTNNVCVVKVNKDGTLMPARERKNLNASFLGVGTHKGFNNVSISKLAGKLNEGDVNGC